MKVKFLFIGALGCSALTPLHYVGVKLSIGLPIESWVRAEAFAVVAKHQSAGVGLSFKLYKGNALFVGFGTNGLICGYEYVCLESGVFTLSGLVFVDNVDKTDYKTMYCNGFGWQHDVSCEIATLKAEKKDLFDKNKILRGRNQDLEQEIACRNIFNNDALMHSEDLFCSDTGANTGTSNSSATSESDRSQQTPSELPPSQVQATSDAKPIDFQSQARLQRRRSLPENTASGSEITALTPALTPASTPPSTSLTVNAEGLGDQAVGNGRGEKTNVVSSGSSFSEGVVADTAKALIKEEKQMKDKFHNALDIQMRITREDIELFRPIKEMIANFYLAQYSAKAIDKAFIDITIDMISMIKMRPTKQIIDQYKCSDKITPNVCDFLRDMLTNRISITADKMEDFSQLIVLLALVLKTELVKTKIQENIDFSKFDLVMDNLINRFISIKE